MLACSCYCLPPCCRSVCLGPPTLRHTGQSECVGRRRGKGRGKRRSKRVGKRVGKKRRGKRRGSGVSPLLFQHVALQYANLERESLGDNDCVCVCVCVGVVGGGEGMPFKGWRPEQSKRNMKVASSLFTMNECKMQLHSCSQGPLPLWSTLCSVHLTLCMCQISLFFPSVLHTSSNEIWR